MVGREVKRAGSGRKRGSGGPCACVREPKHVSKHVAAWEAQDTNGRVKACSQRPGVCYVCRWASARVCLPPRATGHTWG